MQNQPPLTDAVRRAASVTPSPRQLRWQELEFYGFIHFGMNTFTGREWGDGTASPALFDPQDLDPDQWAQAAAAAGMRGLILTCKHHDGFCLWPSRYTDYTVAASPWQGGKGDVVRQTAEACRRAGIRFGVYLSPWDRHEATYGSGEAYNRFYLNQLTELLTGYGELFCVWLDGACGEGPDGRVQHYDWQGWYDAVRRCQPGAVICVSGPDVRWCGNEAGHTRPAEWSVVPAALQDPDYTAARSQQADDGNFARHFDAQDDDLGSRAALEHAGPLAWYPAEVDTSIRPGWFYHPEEDAQVRTAEELFGLYVQAVGGNASLLLNLPPMPTGRLAEPDLASLRELGALLRARLGRDLAPAAHFAADTAAPGHDAGQARPDVPGWWQAAAGQQTARLTLRFDAPTPVRYLSLREELTVGQRIEEGCVLADGREAARFTVVGARRICDLGQTVTCTELTICLDASRTEPTLREICVY
ncbi:MAG: alpha-L-fucosidase [Blautia massiliensis (ex Durand et al. 2017)]